MRIVILYFILLLLYLATAIAGPSQPATYIPAATVQAAFAKDSVLFDSGSNYRVLASRRDAAGQVEVHTKEADVIYVIKGTATLVTGGDIVDAKTIAPDEIRGTSSQGGEVRHLVKGDVVIVPAGTPHWFKEVQAPFLYYVVKAR